jgi:hypothetical protein
MMGNWLEKFIGHKALSGPRGKNPTCHYLKDYKARELLVIKYPLAPIRE